MSEHRATVTWRRETPDFAYATYNRHHEWHFDGGLVVKASAALGRPEDMGTINPERALVAALSSCHMLTFLALAAKKRLVVDSYEDEAIGMLERNAAGRPAVAKVTLRPLVHFAEGLSLPSSEVEYLHHRAHEGCIIANSVKTDVQVVPRN